MDISFTIIAGGSLGFILYEFLRIYKKRIAGQDVSEIFARDYYFIILFGAFVVGVTAAVLASGEPIEAIYLGFSLPTCASAILGKGSDITDSGATDVSNRTTAAKPTADKNESTPAEQQYHNEEGGETEHLEEIYSVDQSGFLSKFRNYLFIGS